MCLSLFQKKANAKLTTALTHTSRPYCDLATTQDAAQSPWTQQGRSEEPKDAQGRRPSANILNMHKTVVETQHSC